MVKIYLESFTQLKIVMCLMNSKEKLNVYDLMKKLKYAKTTIIDNLNKINYVISIAKHKIKIDNTKGRPITHFFLLDNFKQQNSIILRVNYLKYQKNIKSIVHTIIMNNIKNIQNLKHNIDNFILKEKNKKLSIRIVPFKETIKILKENKENNKPVHLKFINEL